MTGKSSLQIWGDLDLTAPDGTHICPPGVKERAILATLALAPSQKRARRWLQAILWGDAAPEAAATNLRQSIARLKKALAPAPGLLQVDRMSVWLAPGLVEVSPRSGSAELFEGLDVGEEAFEDWLLDERQLQDTAATPVLHRIDPPKSAPDARPVLTLRAGRGLVPDDAEVHRLSSALRTRLLGLEVIDLREAIGAVPVPKGLMIQIERAAPDQSIATLVDVDRGRTLWTQTAHQTDQDDIATAELVDGAIEAVLGLTEPGQMGEAAQLAGLMDMGQVFEGLFTPGILSIEDMMARVERGLATNSNALLFALRNCIRMLQYGERQDGHADIGRELVRADLGASLRHGPSNGVVHGLASHAHALFLKDTEAAIEHGEMALAAAPHSSVCTALVALAYLRAGAVDRARPLAIKAVQMGRMSRYRPFLDATCAAALAGAADFDAARKHAERALIRSPDFSAARKILFLAEERLGRTEDAVATARFIRQTEPEFGARILVSEASTVNVQILRKPMAESAERLGFK